MQIAIYGTGKKADFFCEILKKRNEKTDIVYFVETKKTKDNYRGKKVISVEEVAYSDFDCLIITSDIYYEEMISNLKLYSNEYEQHKDKIMKQGDFFLKNWDRARSVMPYQSCIVCDDIVYVALSEDEYIAKSMYVSGRNYSEDIINAFFRLVKKYYGRDKEEQGYFLDIGANIGTTSIYVKKKINPALHIIGFEAGKSNYDLFRVNCILNQMEDIKVELLGLSNSNIEKKYRYNKQNPGGSGIVNDDAEAENISIVKMMKLDEYLSKNNILSDSIDYIWMDTEGYESEIIDGAMETLKDRKIPLLQEFNPITYFRRNTLELYCQNIKKVYSYFLDANEYIAGKEKIIPISEIHDFADKMIESDKAQTDLFFF